MAWQTIKDYPKYEITETGLVRNKRTKRILKPILLPQGYYVVSMYDNKLKYKQCYMHRLTAETFLPNPECKQTINHKDGVKTNNTITNLEWATYSENCKHAYDTGLKKPTIQDMSHTYRKVEQYSLDNTFIKLWDSISEAARAINAPPTHICRVCAGRRKSTRGYIWRYSL